MLQFEEVHFITPDTMFIRDGRSGLVECAAQGSPMPTITWPGLQSEYADLMESSEGTVGENFNPFHTSFIVFKQDPQICISQVRV